MLSKRDAQDSEEAFKNFLDSKGFCQRININDIVVVSIMVISLNGGPHIINERFKVSYNSPWGYEVTCASFLPNYGFDRHTIASNFFKFTFDENDKRLKFVTGKGLRFQVALETIQYYT